MSDDFDFDDDIELNEDLLKALQDTEDRYALTTPSQPPSVAPTPPAEIAKPQATGLRRDAPNKQRKAVVPPRSRVFSEDMDDTPDISLSVDGSYALQSSSSVPPALSQVRALGPPTDRAGTSKTTSRRDRVFPPPTSSANIPASTISHPPQRVPQARATNVASRPPPSLPSKAQHSQRSFSAAQSLRSFKQSQPPPITNEPNSIVNGILPNGGDPLSDELRRLQRQVQDVS